MHEGQRHEFSEAAGLPLQRADTQQVPRPVPRPVYVAEHDRRRTRRPCAMRARITSSQPAVSSLSGQITARTSSSRISAAVPGSVAGPAAAAGAGTPRATAPASGAVLHLERRERVHVDVRNSRLDGRDDVEVGLGR
jgi:hypothetical protein